MQAYLILLHQHCSSISEHVSSMCPIYHGLSKVIISVTIKTCKTKTLDEVVVRGLLCNYTMFAHLKKKTDLATCCKVFLYSKSIDILSPYLIFTEGCFQVSHISIFLHT